MFFWVGVAGCAGNGVPTDLFEYIEMHQTVRAQSKNNSAENVIICMLVYIITIDDIYIYTAAGGSTCSPLLQYYTDERHGADFSI